MISIIAIRIAATSTRETAPLYYYQKWRRELNLNRVMKMSLQYHQAMHHRLYHRHPDSLAV